MGVCDTLTGACSCRTGFSGSACDRRICPGTTPCNGLGECKSMYYYALTKDAGLGTVFSYATNWDAQKIWGCDCDTYYGGPDCSQRLCPTGDDPLTGYGVSTVTNPNQYNEIQRVSCYAGGGTFTLSFRKETTVAIPYTASQSILEAAIGALPSVGAGTVKVTMYGPRACLEAGTQFTVEFLQNFGALPLLVPDSRNLFFKDALSTVKLVVVKNRVGTKENDRCSNRGVCDPTTGYCTCSTSYATSNGYAAAGLRGDCGYATTTITVRRITIIIT
jgi:hypothetical protein